MPIAPKAFQHLVWGGGADRHPLAFCPPKPSGAACGMPLHWRSPTCPSWGKPLLRSADQKTGSDPELSPGPWPSGAPALLDLLLLIRHCHPADHSRDALIETAPRRDRDRLRAAGREPPRRRPRPMTAFPRASSSKAALWRPGDSRGKLCNSHSGKFPFELLQRAVFP